MFGRIALSCWIFGIESIFVNGDSSMSSFDSAYNGVDVGRLTKHLSLPHFLLLLLILGSLIVYEFLKATVYQMIQTIVHLCSKKVTVVSVEKGKEVTRQAYTEIYKQIVPPMNTFGHAVGGNKICHELILKEEAQRGWCHVCSKTLWIVPCVDPKCAEWHEKRRMWMATTVVQGNTRKKGDFLLSWEVIRLNSSLYSYHVGFNPNYQHIIHLRNEEMLIEKVGGGKGHNLQRRMSDSQRRKSLADDVEKTKHMLEGSTRHA